MECVRCRAHNRESLRFCEECGAPLFEICSSCHAEVSRDKGYCGSCGAPNDRWSPDFGAARTSTSYSGGSTRATANAVEGERKHATVLFADLKGSMGIIANRDPEEARE